MGVDYGDPTEYDELPPFPPLRFFKEGSTKENKTKIMNQINLGDKVKDKITGYMGIAISITKFINGCDRVAVQPQNLDKDGKIQEAQYFDIFQLKILKTGVIEKGTEATGGPQPAPQRAKDCPVR